MSTTKTNMQKKMESNGEPIITPPKAKKATATKKPGAAKPKR